jgi:UPF0042 nucleotide-binding protein
MKLVIISGRSGSGKSSALNLLEDEGYYCIDNLPITLLPELVRHLDQQDIPGSDKVALCVDARNRSQDLNRFTEMIDNQPEGIDTQIIFLDADRDRLIKRFSETRRRHPLSNANVALTEAIDLEEQLLAPIRNLATLVINTTDMSLHDLRSTIKARLVNRAGAGISVQFQSFGFKRGVPVDADFIYDVRVLPNPHWDPELRSLTGRDQGVIDFLSEQPDVESMYFDICDYLQKWLPHFENNNRSYITVGIGCTGGQHRSVYLAERLASHFAGLYTNVQVRHRELAPLINSDS